MKFLIDNNLSPLLADALKAAGYDAVHLRDLGMQAATDHVVLEHARADERILVSADTDFGGLLARSGASTPSMVLIRRLAGRRAAEQAAIILANLDQVAEDLKAGAIVVPARPASDNHAGCPPGSGSGARSCTTRTTTADSLMRAR